MGAARLLRILPSGADECATEDLMKRSTVLNIFAAALLAAPFTAYAAKPATKPTVAKPQVKVTTSKAPKPQPVKAVKTTSHAHAAKPVKAVKPATSVKPVKATKQVKTTAPAKTTKAAKSTTTTTTTTTTTAASNTTGTTTPVTLTPVQQKLQKNTKLTAKLQARLPVGTDLMTAAAGFKNLGQFVAAVNVSNNLQIPFADLKTKMVTEGLSLGQSIQALRPAASSTVEASRAEYDARGMILETEAATTTTAPTATSTTPTVSATPTTTSTTTTTTTTTTAKAKAKGKPKSKKANS